MLKRIYTLEERKAMDVEKATKALMLNGYVKPDYDPRFDPTLNQKLKGVPFAFITFYHCGISFFSTLNGFGWSSRISRVND
jgi:hypothetical protein